VTLWCAHSLSPCNLSPSLVLFTIPSHFFVGWVGFSALVLFVLARAQALGVPSLSIFLVCSLVVASEPSECLQRTFKIHFDRFVLKQ
jgi:hypothetical protein